MIAVVTWFAVWLFTAQTTASDDAKARAADAHARAMKEPVKCTQCHADLVAARYVHGPAANDGCLDCHQIVAKPQGPAAVALRAQGTEGCVSCHDEIKSRLGEKHVHAPVAAGECTTCHDPHSAPYRYQLKAEGPEACVMCHEDIGDDLKRAVVHKPTANCVTCHDPHGGAFPRQTRRPLNELCMDCHGDSPGAEERSHRKASAPVVDLDVEGKRGHPVAGHVVTGPRDPKSPDRPFTCASCHNPHGAKGGKLFRFEAMSLSELCVKCHNM